MSKRLEHALKGLLLIGMALFLTHRFVSGTLLYYINRRFVWLTWVAAILLTLMAYAYQRKQPVAPAHNESDEPHHLHNHQHHSGGAWIPLVIVAIPLLLGVLVSPQPLGAQAVSRREVNLDGVGLGGGEQAMAQETNKRNILDWLRAFSAAEDPISLAGQEAQVIGFVYHDNTLARDQFMVSRFVVSCCVADATVLGLIVSWPDSHQLPADTWVEVTGHFAFDPDKAEPIPTLIADVVIPTAPPIQPYLYP
jgi:uncharacterized repeat protein (TIGR03943 family)